MDDPSECCAAPARCTVTDFDENELIFVSSFKQIQPAHTQIIRPSAITYIRHSHSRKTYVTLAYYTMHACAVCCRFRIADWRANLRCHWQGHTAQHSTQHTQHNTMHLQHSRHSYISHSRARSLQERHPMSPPLFLRSELNRIE